MVLFGGMGWRWKGKGKKTGKNWRGGIRMGGKRGEMNKWIVRKTEGGGKWRDGKGGEKCWKKERKEMVGEKEERMQGKNKKDEGVSNIK